MGGFGEGMFMLRNKVSTYIVLSFILLTGLSPYAVARIPDDKKHKPTGTPILWQEPTDLTSRDLFWGTGGEAMKPDLSHVTFIKDQKGGHSKKYRVRDGAGREWVAKIGAEAQPETVATRLLWGVGYFTEITYLVPSVTIEGKGTFENVRFEARPKNVKRLDEWGWEDNPFVGTPEFQGLKVMMLLLNNWDIKDINNKILFMRNEATGANELQYIISDLGATFGKTGSLLTRSRNNPEDFIEAKFIDELKGEYVDFHYSGKRKDVFRDITREQARWAGKLLSQLTRQQIEDAFRAANYSPEEIQDLADALRGRISELTTIPR